MFFGRNTVDAGPGLTREARRVESVVTEIALSIKDEKGLHQYMARPLSLLLSFYFRKQLETI